MDGKKLEEKENEKQQHCLKERGTYIDNNLLYDHIIIDHDIPDDTWFEGVIHFNSKTLYGLFTKIEGKIISLDDPMRIIQPTGELVRAYHPFTSISITCR